MKSRYKPWWTYNHFALLIFCPWAQEAKYKNKLSIMTGIMEPIWEKKPSLPPFFSLLYICILWSSLFDSLQLATKEIYLHFFFPDIFSDNSQSKNCLSRAWNCNIRSHAFKTKHLATKSSSSSVEIFCKLKLWQLHERLHTFINKRFWLLRSYRNSSSQWQLNCINFSLN